MSNNLFVSPSPHVKGDQSSQTIMRDVIIALLPALAVSTLYFGVNVLLVSAIAVASAVFFEFVIRRYLMNETMGGDLSPIVTGLLLAFNLPATIPLWIVVIGSLVAIAIAKMSFGGLGKNPFNPALVGRVFLLIAYPVQMTTFPAVKVDGAVDIFSGATPLTAVKAGFSTAEVNYQDMLFGSIPGSFGEVASLVLLLGGVYLLFRHVITWHIPTAMLGSMALFALIYSFATGYDAFGALQFTLFHILAGGAILGAVFMATDYTTSPMTHKGMVIFGVGIGVITMLIRLWGAYPEGVSFAILIMNSCVPLINKYVKPKRFGTK